jgi:hypothetical protein
MKHERVPILERKPYKSRPSESPLVQAVVSGSTYTQAVDCDLADLNLWLHRKSL